MKRTNTDSRNSRYQSWTFLLCLLALFGCQDNLAVRPIRGALPPPPPVATPTGGLGAVFTDITESSGIDFSQSAGDDEVNHAIEAVGSGAVFFDYDQDGLPDLYLATGKYVEGISHGAVPWSIPRNRLYHNLGNGIFEDVTDAAGVAVDANYSFGVSSADFNNDHYPDLYVCNYGRSILFLNNRNGTFSDVGNLAGVGLLGQFAISSVWFDYDNDGRVDLLVNTRITSSRPLDFVQPWESGGRSPDLPDYRCHLFRNFGNSHFEDVSASVGLDINHQAGEYVSTVDVEGDGFLDILASGPSGALVLLHNQQGRSFRWGRPSDEANAAASVVRPDLLPNPPDLAPLPDGNFRAALFPADSAGGGGGLAATGSGDESPVSEVFGTVSLRFDIDNDGDLDVFNVNSGPSRLQGAADQLLENLGDGHYRDISSQAGAYFQQKLCGRGAAIADVDQDGDLDILVMNYNGPAVLLRNDGGNRNHWLSIALEGRTSNRDGLGASVRAIEGDQVQVAAGGISGGPLSQNDSRLHFGLGSHPQLNRMEIRWPSGIEQVLERIPANQHLILVEPAPSAAGL